MILSLIAALFVLLVAAFWAMQGLFSSAIMLVETIIALMVAFGYYEPLSGLVTEYIPEYAQGAALVVLFAGTLTILRVLTDKFIPGNVQFPMPVDRAGGGLLGLLTGLMLIGTTLTGVQMLPLGSAPLGFQRVSFDPPGRRSIWLNPDGFAVGMASLLSTGRFGGESLERAHPDLLGELATTNTGFQVESRRIVPPNSVAVKNYWQVDAIDTVTQTQQGEVWKRDFAKAPPEDSSRRYMIVRLAIDGVAADKTDGTSEPAVVRFTPAQFRLVGKAAEGAVAPVVTAAGLSDIFSEKIGAKLDPFVAQRVVKWKADQRFGLGSDNATALAKDGKYQIDVAFEVSPEFSPWYLQFKSNARAEITPGQMLKKPPPTLERPKPPPPAKKGKKSEDDEEEDEDAGDSSKKGDATESKKGTAKPSADSEDEEAEESAPAKTKSHKPAKKDESSDEDEDESSDDSKSTKTKKATKKDESSDEGDDESSGDDEKPAKSKPKAKKPSDDEESSDEEKSDGEQAAAAAAAPKPKVGEKQAGRTNVASAVEEATGVSSKLPVAIKKSDVPSSALAAGKFKEGHFVIEGVGGKIKKGEAVKEFQVPEDMVMVQIGAEKNFAGSTLGQALEFAKQALAQIFVTSEGGDQYFALGVYTAATVNGKRVLELQYWPEKREEMPERALEPAKRLTTNLLKTAANQNDLKMGFLFLVPKGTHLVKFNTTSRNGQAIDIDAK